MTSSQEKMDMRNQEEFSYSIDSPDRLEIHYEPSQDNEQS